MRNLYLQQQQHALSQHARGHGRSGGASDAGACSATGGGILEGDAPKGGLEQHVWGGAGGDGSAAGGRRIRAAKGGVQQGIHYLK